jgi:hypothetical protein
MDIRRAPPSRAASGGVEPRFRQVGFVTAAEPARGPVAPAAASPTASDGLSPVMIPPPLIPAPAPASESLMPSSPPPASSYLLEVVSDLDDYADDDDIDVSWARPPPPALPGTWFYRFSVSSIAQGHARLLFDSTSSSIYLQVRKLDSILSRDIVVKFAYHK